MNEKIYQVIRQIFSESGYNVGYFSVRIPNDCSINITYSEENISIKFTNGNKPTISISKFLRLKAALSEVELGKDGGVLRLERFPDFHFKYESLT